MVESISLGNYPNHKLKIPMSKTAIFLNNISKRKDSIEFCVHKLFNECLKNGSITGKIQN